MKELFKNADGVFRETSDMPVRPRPAPKGEQTLADLIADIAAVTIQTLAVLAKERRRRV